MPSKKIRCVVIDDEPAATDVIVRYIQSINALELAGVYHDSLDALELLGGDHADLLFLDIQMPQLLGTEFIRSLKNPPRVIFTTAYREYAIEGFELNAVDYLLKPVSFERFLKAINKVMDVNIHPSGSKSNKGSSLNAVDNLFFRCNRKLVNVPLQDILYVESIKDYIKVVTNNKTLITKQSISYIESYLPKDHFIRIHRSYIVALGKINSYSKETLEINKQELPVSRMYRLDLERVILRGRDWHS